MHTKYCQQYSVPRAWIPEGREWLNLDEMRLEMAGAMSQRGLMLENLVVF